MAAQLHQPPEIITVNEPWDAMRLAPDRLFASLRKEISSTGTLGRGTLDIPLLISQGRIRRIPEDHRPDAVSMQDATFLGVKWPGYFRLIPLLPETKFLVCVRDPLEVIASFKAIGGSVGRGLDYDTRWNRQMNTTLRRATRDRAMRRVLLFDYVHGLLIPLLEQPNVLVVRYEEWFSEPRRQLQRIADFLGCPVREGPVRLRAESKVSALSSDEVELIRARCRTAGSLGYTLDSDQFVN